MFDFAQYDNDQRFGFGFGHGQRVRLQFWITQGAGLHMLESLLSKDQQAKDLDDDWLEISATVMASAILERWLQEFGGAVRDVRKNSLDTEGA